MDYDSSPAYSHSSAVLFSPPDVGRGGGYGRESDLYSSPYGNEHDDRVEARLLHPDEPDEGLGYFPRQSVAATSSFGSSSEKGLLASSAPPPVETITMTTLRVVLPATILPLITGLAWGWALYTIKPRSFPLIGDWLITHPSTMTYIISLTSSILSILVSWSFGRSAAYFISKRMARDPCSVEEVGAWVYLSTHQIKWSMSRWIFITGIATVFLSIQTAGFNSLLAPQTYKVELRFDGRPEIDFESPGFDTFYANATSHGYFDCFWPDARGVITPSCAFSSGFFELLLGGRANVEKQVQKRTTYSRVGRLNLEGPTGGVLPFTSISPSTRDASSNSIDDGSLVKVSKLSSEISRLKADYHLNMTLQGITADIRCQWSDSSPLESTYGSVSTSDARLNLVTTTAPSCDRNFVLVQYAPVKRASSVACEIDGQWQLFVRLFDTYVLSTDENDPMAAQENLTCSVSPFVSSNSASYWSKTTSTAVDRDSSIRSSQAPSKELKLHLDAHVADLQRSVNNILVGGTAEANLVVEAVNSLRPGVTKPETQQTWELLLTGMLELDATFARHNWETLVRPPYLDSDAFAGWRRVPTVLYFEGFGWQSKWTNFLLLSPLSCLCFVATFFVMAGLFTPGDLLTFDPSDISMLVMATARGDLGSAASETDRHDAAVLRGAKLQFRPPMGGGRRPWGLYR